MELLTYLLKVTVCTAIFFSFYLLILRKLTFFRINRFYLLITLLLSFIIPAVQLTIEREAPKTIDVEIPVQQDFDLSDHPKPEMPAMVPIVNAQVPKTIDWFALIPYGYGIVTLVMLSLFAWRLCRLLAYTRYPKEKVNGLKLVPKPSGFTNCSFFNYVFIQKEGLSETDLQVLLKHEQVHSSQLHSIDKMLLLLFKALLWFNPIVYLYDQALEQNHEYEADELSAADVGNHAYAGLLLRLAVSQSSMPLVHNFVKSPVKDRIKMMFNSKSKEMKKFIYVLAMPMALLLVWTFSVQVVYAERKTTNEYSLQDTTRKRTIKNKELALPNIKRNDPYLKSADYLNKEKLSKAVSGKTITGKLGALYVNKRKISNGRLFITEGNTYVISSMGNVDLSKLKEHEEVSVDVMASSITKEDPYVGLFPKKIMAGTQLVYEMPKPELHPFLYEANKVRFNDGEIQSISNTNKGKDIVVLVNGYTFTMSIDATQTNPDYFNEYKKGDQVRMRFVHEVKTGAKSYSVADWISISKNIRTFGVLNKKLFSRFYKENGFQKVAATHTDRKVSAVTPKIISFDKMTTEQAGKLVKLNKGVVEVAGNMLEGDELVYDKEKGSIVAKKASITKGGAMVVSDYIVYDLNTGVYNADFDKGRISGSNPDNNVMYVADSVRISRDKSTLYLYGNASLTYKNKRVTGSQIAYDSKKEKLNVKDAAFYSGDSKALRADSMRIDMNSPKIKAFGSFGVAF